ncbi:hypothetical protein ABAC402_19115 [Asticcacaulis sp. AC402]|nr:hypothetical protein ABAC402_19115 [Asticcacaulis sp. AC402]
MNLPWDQIFSDPWLIVMVGLFVALGGWMLYQKWRRKP